MARRRKSAKKRRGKESSGSVSSVQSLAPSEPGAAEEGPESGAGRWQDTEPHTGGSWSACEGADGPGVDTVQRKRKEDGDEEDPVALLRLPEMTDTSMDSVGQPLCDVMDRLNGTLDRESWDRAEEEEEERTTDEDAVGDGSRRRSTQAAAPPPQLQPFRGDSGGEPPDPLGHPGPLAPSPGFLRAPPAPADFYCFTSHSEDPAATGGGGHDPAGDGQPTAVPGGHADEGETEAEAASPHTQPQPQPRHAHRLALEEVEGEEKGLEETSVLENGVSPEGGSEEEQPSPTESSHPAEFR